MSFLSENVIPGNCGKIFETDASEDSELERIQNVILEIPGIKDVIIDKTTFPKKITIHTSSLVKVKTIEDAVKRIKHHVIPKSLFEL